MITKIKDNRYTKPETKSSCYYVEAGLYCIECQGAAFESLENGAKTHG